MNKTKQQPTDPPFPVNIGEVTTLICDACGFAASKSDRQEISRYDDRYSKDTTAIDDWAVNGKRRTLDAQAAAVASAAGSGQPLPNVLMTDEVEPMVRRQTELLKAKRDGDAKLGTPAAKRILQGFLTKAEPYVEKLGEAEQQQAEHFKLPHKPSATLLALRYVVGVHAGRLETLADYVGRPATILEGLLL